MERSLSSAKPVISKKALLVFSGIIWLLAGGLFIKEGVLFIIDNSRHILFHISIGSVCGILLYVIFFNRIFRKYTCRICNFESFKFSFFCFENMKQFLLLGVIIATLFYLSKTNILNNFRLSIAYIGIGLPLLLSSFIFFFSITLIKKSADICG